jgi:hypothetical protein
MAKRANVCKKEILADSREVRFTFTGMAAVVVATDALADEVLEYAMLHGLAQKLGDSYSGAQTVEEARERFDATLAVLESGEWNGGRAATGGLWIDAIADVQGIDREAALARWNELDEDKQAAIKKVPRVKAAYAKLAAERAERAAAGTNAEELDDIFV